MLWESEGRVTVKCGKENSNHQEERSNLELTGRTTRKHNHYPRNTNDK